MLDIGSHQIRGGYSGEDTPRMNTHSAVGVVEKEGKKEYYANDMLEIRRDNMTVERVTDNNGYGIGA